ncbi:uncharacterized protein LOC144994091 [Oryzias latipes]
MTILTTTGDFKGQCRGITANESNTCVGVNSTDLQVFLNSGKMSKRFCNFSVEEFACASLSALTAQDLVEIMKCDLSSNSSGSISAWNLLFCKTSGILNAALNLLTTATINPNNPAVSVILDSIQAISPDLFSTNTLNNLTELQLWFNVRLRPFLPAVSTNFLSILATKDLQCNSYQYILQILSEVQPQMTLSKQESVYTQFIKIYLSRKDTAATSPKCYDSNNPELNSTAWFAEYIGSFITFLTVVDLQSFGSQQDLQLFTVNPQNLLLLNQYKVDVTIVIYYIQLVYQQDINFSPLGLPSLGQCFAPGRVFTQLTSQESLTVLGNVNRVCTDIDPQIAAALASNFGKNIDAKVISALGNESTSLSISQIKSLKPSDLVDSLNILSNVIGWRKGQAKAIVLSLLTSGFVQINSSASLLNLGSLISGVPSTVFSSISGSDLVTVSRNPSVLFYILSAPQIVQLTFVIKIIYLNTNSLQIIENVPDNLATEIPGVYLLQFPNDISTVIRLNRKKWKPQQVGSPVKNPYVLKFVCNF